MEKQKNKKTNKRSNNKLHIQKFWCDKRFWILLVIMVSIASLFFLIPNQISTLETAINKWVQNLVVTSSNNSNTPLSPETSIKNPNSTTSNNPSVIGWYSLMPNAVADKINNERIDKRLNPIYLNDELVRIAAQTNLDIRKYVLTKQERLEDIVPEIYRCSVFVVNCSGTDINKIDSGKMIDLWIHDSRESVRLNYPFTIGNIGLNMNVYDDYVVCVMVVKTTEINMTDRRYWELIPTFYELNKQIVN